ncbi:hypothetical protein GCM10025787_36450 [Saccharopolyspora rosea]|uniref:S1 family peptidase n=1 Tax=Saccharopolyspora rosea TaxID=524884 RepID=A0ABW3FZD0_9PSEU
MLNLLVKFFTRLSAATAPGIRPAAEAPSGIVDIQFKKHPTSGEPGFHCGCGALIAPDKVVTAAHLLDISPWGPLGAADMQVRIGSLDRTQGGTLCDISDIQLHPDWRAEMGDVDLAILHLAERCDAEPFTIASRACEGNRARRLLGWAVTDGIQPAEDDQSKTARFLNEQETFLMPSFLVSQCTKKPVPEGFLCIGVREEMRFGASGAPVLCASDEGWVLEGILSHGIGGKLTLLPSLAVRLDLHHDWLMS